MRLSTPQIVAQLERVLTSEPAAAAVAIRAAARESWPDLVTVRNRQFTLRWCESALAIREALAENERHEVGPHGLVVITPLATHEVADDIGARLARGRIYQPEAWDVVRQLFQAKDTDARLGRHAWMAQALIDAAAQGPYAPVANGFLDLDTAWREVLRRFLGLDSARPDAVSLLLWCAQPGAQASLALLPATQRVDIARWLGECAGRTGAMVLACIDAGRAADALALGLVCGVIHAPAGTGEVALGQAAIRLERYVGDRHVGIVEGLDWCRAAERAVHSAGPDAVRASLDRADGLLHELHIGDFAYLSDLLPSAFDQRMRAFGAALLAQVQATSEARLACVEQSADRAVDHVLARQQPQRLERVEMARRLARWLMQPSPSVETLGMATAWQSDQGAFIDWARFRLLGGDELPEVSEAYDAMRTEVIARRNAVNRSFAQVLLQSNARPPTADTRLVPIETVLERVVAPISARLPVLLLVMDGLSISIYRELFATINSLGWEELTPAGTASPLIGLAALPTVTAVSRASLLCGRLTMGTAATEKTGFAGHPALLAHSDAGLPPRLFHKGELADSTNLAPEIRTAIANPRQRVVGVVYNAIDDHLSGPDQLRQRWALDDLRLLLPLLREAREVRRAVVITADHGHLLEDSSAMVGIGSTSERSGDRWRPGLEAQAPHELGLSGGRVVTADDSASVVCLWGERTRYSGRKNGYHGGVSPQEVAVPLSVIVPLDMALPGWQPAAPAQPDWWDLPPLAPMTQIVATPASRPTARHLPAPAAQASLFDSPDAGASPPASAPGDWISALLVSPIYRSQRELAARVALPDDMMRRLLASLAERGGKLSHAALAQRLALPELRLSGFLSAARRMLNVDQAAVLTVDSSVGTVELNRSLLLRQFRLELNGGQP